ncbi:MAG: hypothetical protein AAGB29_05260 [Planctomycetota bacterium]
MPVLPPLTPILAQAMDWDRVIFWVVALVGLAIAGAVVLVVVRKVLMSESVAPPSVGFGLRDLEAMRDRGELTDEEYQRARGKMVARLAGEDEPGEAEVPVEVVPGEAPAGDDTPATDEPPGDNDDEAEQPDEPGEPGDDEPDNRTG